MSDQDVDGFVPVPVPLGDGRHDIGDERRAAIVQRLISDWSHDPDLPPEKVRQLAMWAAASVRALFHELGTLQDTMTPAATSPDVAALDAEKLVERYCRFNCDLESSCRCAVHEVYRALHAELLTTQQWARAEHMDVLRLEAYQAATRAALQQKDVVLECYAKEQERLRADVQRVEQELVESKKDWRYHSECRPNRMQAEAAIADAKAMNDKWADEVGLRRAAEAALQRVEQERDALKTWWQAATVEKTALEARLAQLEAELALVRQVNNTDLALASERVLTLELRLAQVEATLKAMDDAAEMLWVVLANVSGGDWTKQSQDWQDTAARWRDNYFAALRERPPA